MNKKRPLVLLPLFAMTLTSCGQAPVDYKEHLEDYVFEMSYHTNFNILQLTDLHWNVNSSTASSKAYLDKLFEQVNNHVTGKIDLVELTGDQFMLANTYHVQTLLEYMEYKATQYGFNYAIIWGNHDRHGLYSPNWLANQYRSAQHCIYIEPNDNLYGRSNFVINLNEGTNTKWQIFNLDSGASFSESPLSIGRNYDYIRNDQVDWYEKEQKAGVSSIAYYHIPQQDNGLAWESRATREHKRFFKLEGFGDAGKEEFKSTFIPRAKEIGCLKGAFMGHAHNVDWTVDYDGIILGLGVKTGAELYYAHIDPNDTNADVKEGLASVNAALPEGQKITEKFDLIGASLVTIKDDQNFDLEHLYYNMREGADDFVRWVKF